MSGLDIRDNAFYLLRVTPATPIDQIEFAFEDAASDGRGSENDLLQAQRSLGIPRKRLDEEVSWVFGATPEQVEEILSQVESGLPFSSIPEKYPMLTNLALANLAAHACGATTNRTDSAPDETKLEWLLDGQLHLKTEDVRTMINEARNSIEGVPEASAVHVGDALKKLHELHRQSALSAICQTRHPGEAMTQIAEKYRYHETLAGNFVSELVRDYDGWSLPILRECEKEIDSEISRIKKNYPNCDGAVTKIESLLAKWDEYSQPVQLLSEARGLDEGRSKTIFEKLREVALWLNNDKSDHEVALRLTTAMLRTFAELPDATRRLTQDLNALKDNAARKGQAEEGMEALGTFVELVKKIQENPKKSAKSISKGAESPLVQELIGTLETLIGMNMDDNLGVWKITRSLAVEFHNEHQETEAAWVLTAVLYGLAQTHHPSHEIEALLREDLVALEKMRSQGSASSDSSIEGFLGCLLWIGGAIFVLYKLVLE